MIYTRNNPGVPSALTQKQRWPCPLHLYHRNTPEYSKPVAERRLRGKSGGGSASPAGQEQSRRQGEPPGSPRALLSPDRHLRCQNKMHNIAPRLDRSLLFLLGAAQIRLLRKPGVLRHGAATSQATEGCRQPAAPTNHAVKKKRRTNFILQSTARNTPSSKHFVEKRDAIHF